MDAKALKAELHVYEENQDWKSVLILLRTTWRVSRDGSIAGFCIDELCFLLMWSDDHPEKGIAPFYDEIQDFLDEIVIYGLSHYLNHPFFLWRLGHWMKGGWGYGYMLLNEYITEKNYDSICKKVLELSYSQWDSPLVYSDIACIHGNWNWLKSCSSE